MSRYRLKSSWSAPTNEAIDLSYWGPRVPMPTPSEITWPSSGATGNPSLPASFTHSIPSFESSVASSHSNDFYSSSASSDGSGGTGVSTRRPSFAAIAARTPVSPPALRPPVSHIQPRPISMPNPITTPMNIVIPPEPMEVSYRPKDPYPFDPCGKRRATSSISPLPRKVTPPPPPSIPEVPPHTGTVSSSTLYPSTEESFTSNTTSPRSDTTWETVIPAPCPSSSSSDRSLPSVMSRSNSSSSSNHSLPSIMSETSEYPPDSSPIPTMVTDNTQMSDTASDSQESSLESMLQPYVCRPPSEDEALRPHIPLPILAPMLHHVYAGSSDITDYTSSATEHNNPTPLHSTSFASNSSDITDYMSSSHEQSIPIGNRSSSSGITDYLSSTIQSKSTSSSGITDYLSSHDTSSTDQIHAPPIPSAFYNLRNRNQRYERLERVQEELSAETINAHPIVEPAGQQEPESDHDVKLFPDQSQNPSFLPENQSTLPPNVTADWGAPIPAARSQFLGQQVFTHETLGPEMIYPQPLSRSTAPTNILPFQPSRLVVPPSKFNLHRSNTVLSSHSSDSSVDSSTAPALPPRHPFQATQPIIKPAKLSVPTSFGFLGKAVRKEIDRQKEKKAKKDSSSSSSSSSSR